MLDMIIRLSLRHRVIVLFLALFVASMGSLSLSKLPIDVFPDITKPTVTVMTEAPGRAPEEVETLITIPLEYALTGLPGMERVRSVSGVGLSIIYLEFSWGTDIYRARQLVSERLNLAQAQLPSDTPPIMGPVSSIMGQIQQIALSSPEGKVSPIELRTLAEWVVRPRLMTIPGVTQVLTLGGGLKQYQILISSEKLTNYQLSLEDVEKALASVSKNTSGGFVHDGNNEVLIRNMGAAASLAEIENTVVGLHFGKPIFIKDIAETKIGAQVKRGDASYMKQPAVIMVIQKQPGANTVAITDKVEEAVAALKLTLPQDVAINPNIFKQSSFIEASIEGVTSKLKLGTVLVFVVLIIFLMNLKMSLITLTAIPLSFLTSFIVFEWLGLSINTMTLGGLAIAIGELVDDSIVDVENIYRRLKENARSSTPQAFLKVVYQASSEVRNSIVLATLIIALVFLPLFQLSGLEGKLFTPLAIAYLTALAASLVVSLTLTPVLCSFLLKSTAEDKNTSRHTDPPLIRWLKNKDKFVLDKILPHPNLVLSVLIGLLVGSFALVFFMGSNFLPKFNEGTAMVAVFSPPGIHLEESNRIGLLAEEKILAVPEVKSVSRRTGRSERDEHAMGVNVSEIDVDFKEEIHRSREKILENIRANLSEIPGIGINVGQPISHLMDHTLSGVSAQLAIKIFGDDLARLRLKAAEAKDIISSTPGLVDLQVEQQGLIPQLKIYPLREEAAQFNMGAGEISSLLASALNGQTVGSIIEGQRFFDLFYRFDEASRSSKDKIEDAVLKTMPDGRKVRVIDVADVYRTQGPNEIGRENGLRKITISANISGRDMASTVAEVKSRLSKNLELDEGYFITYGGQFEAQESAFRKIILFGLVSLLGVFAVLYFHFNSLALTTQIMMTIPFSFIGGICALYFSGEDFTIASLVGFITLCGISSRNGIMMISHYLHLMKHEGESFSKAMVIRGSLERLTPVLMTASVASLALLPIALTSGQPGSEILHPVALVVVGGLLSSTLLDILVTPTLFFKFGKNAAQKSIHHSTNQEGRIL